MQQLTPEQMVGLEPWFVPEMRHLIGRHVLNTGNGACFVDRWPAPRAVLVTIGALCSLSGEPDAVDGDDLRAHVTGLMHTPDPFRPLLAATFPDLRRLERIILALQARPEFHVPADVTVRRLQAADAYHLWALSPDLRWISNTWGGPSGLAASGHAWGVFSDGRLASVACSFLVANDYEDLGVVTASAFRGRGLAGVGVGALCRDVVGRGRCPTWTTSVDNGASLRVAEKLGFTFMADDTLYVLGRPAAGQSR